MNNKSFDIFLKIPKNRIPLGKGVYGKYFKISSRRGVKILGKGYNDSKRLLKSKVWNQAIKECLVLDLISTSGITPKHPKLALVQIDNKFYPGILMEHIFGKTLDSYDDTVSFSDIYIDPKINRIHYGKGNKVVKAHKFVKTLLKKFRVNHRDLHDNNVMITSKNKIKIIDFSPDQIKVGFKI